MLSHEIVFRDFCEPDTEAVIEVYRAAIQSVYPGLDTAAWASDLGDIDRLYVQSGGTFLVGVEPDANSNSDRVIATAGLQKVSETVAEMKRVSVIPNLHGNHIGRRLVGETELRAAQLGFRAIELDTTFGQAASRHLYESMGYILVDRHEVKRPSGNTWDTFFYRKILV